MNDNAAYAPGPAVPHVPQLQVWLAFAFGVVFVSVLLYMAAVMKNPEPFAIKIVLTVLALAAAGVGAVLPGFMEVRYKGFFRAGGSLALFALVYLNAPAIGSSVVRVVPPKVDARPVVELFLKSLDSGEAAASWKQLAPAARAQLDDSPDKWETLYRNAVAPLGRSLSRQLVGESGSGSAMPGMPPGVYKSYTYRTKFQNDNGHRSEMVVVRGNEQEVWEIYQYQVSLAMF
jgi:hypothetical protein